MQAPRVALVAVVLALPEAAVLPPLPLPAQAQLMEVATAATDALPMAQVTLET